MCSGWDNGEKLPTLKSHGREVTPSLSDEKNPRIYLEAGSVTVQEIQSSYMSGIWGGFKASHRPSHGHDWAVVTDTGNAVTIG